MKPGGKGLTLLALAAAMLTGASGCRRHPETHTDPEVLLSFDDSVYSLARLRSEIPGGLPAEDSARLADALLNGWLEDLLFDTYLTRESQEEQEIERKVDDYRRKLRMESYRRRIRRQHPFPVSEDSVRAYYLEHRSEFISERPLVKGLYVKAPSGAASLREVRSLCGSATSADVERLNEIADGEEDIRVEYFGDSWVEFDILASEIPYGFGDPDTFLNGRRDFETAHNGNIHLLHIYRVLPSGNPMPYEFAAELIRDILQESRLEAYRRGLVKALREKALRDGRLKIMPPTEKSVSD